MLCRPRVALLLFALGTSLATAADPDSTFVPTTLIENGATIRLEFVTYRPEGPGPFPTVIIHHGSTGTGRDPALFGRTWSSPVLADFFNRRGWLVIFPQRRGRGRSDGLYDEGFAANRADGYTCEPARSLAGLERALTDLDAITTIVRARSDVDPGRLLVAGVSRGGILAITHAGTRSGLYRGAINFVGGWMSDGCANPTAINTVTFARGGAFPGPTVWLYGQNDPFYSLTHSRANHTAFAAAGGRGDFFAYDLGLGQSGHSVHLFPDRWGDQADALLGTLLPAPTASPSIDSPLANLSLRAAINDAPLIAGFVLGGSRPRTVLLRVAGPSLASYGVSDAAANPSLLVYDASGLLVGQNDDWESTDATLVGATAATVGAFPFPAASRDAAAVATLLPGAYTLHARADQPGTVLIEAYAVP